MRIRWTEPGPARPLLQVRLAAGGRLMIEAYGVPVIVAKVFPPWRDAWLLWAGADRRREVLPPWTAAQCRDYAPDPQRWFFEIRRQLQASTLSPLHAGGWSLRITPNRGTPRRR